jgi:hypothetical protein
MEEEMVPIKGDTKLKAACLRLQVAAVATAVMMFALADMPSAAGAAQKRFASAEEAVRAFVTALRNDDTKELSAILGPGGGDLLFSGDPVNDRQRRELFVKDYDEKNKLDPRGDSAILVIGKVDWPFPIPVVKKGETWFFDTDRGREEILNRRIGRNELNTVQVCLAIVDAQREYAMKDREGDGLLKYAQQFRSAPGTRNGLYWQTKEGEEPSPLGPLVAQARTEGHGRQKLPEHPIPYNGYYYRMLKAQGKHALGGAYDYLVNGKMVGGFAVVAFPATYGNSGVMTFIVNHDGVVYQKDLGKNTGKVATAMKIFDPDASWKKAQETTKQ